MDGAETSERGSSSERAQFRTLLLDVLREDSSLATRVCRVCLRRCDELVRLSDTCSVQMKACAGTYTLAEILSHVTRTKVEEEGGGRVLPAGVCRPCVQACVEAYIFMRTYELNATSLEKCVELLSCHLDEEPRAEQERLIVTVLPRLHDYIMFRDLNMQNVHFDRYKQKRILSRHMAERHGPTDQRKLLCVMCGKTYSTPYSLFCHQAVFHGTARLYYCSGCQFRGKSEEAMLQHIRARHPHDEDAHYSVLEPNDELKQQLDAAGEWGAPAAAAGPALASDDEEAAEEGEAGAEEEGGEALETDAATGGRLRPARRRHACHLCGRAFPRALNLRRHVDREHRHMECQQCRKVFRIRSRYERHLRLHLTDPDLKVYRCTYCDYSARQRRHLVQHTTRRHTDIRPFSCGVCGKGFVKQNEVRSHMVVHTRERPERCTLCDKRFINKAALLYHTRLHTGERPYPCAQCGERFLSASRRGAHVRSKHGPRPQCELCNSTYTNNQVLQKHIHSVHMKQRGGGAAAARDVRTRKPHRKRADDSPVLEQPWPE